MQQHPTSPPKSKVKVETLHEDHELSVISAVDFDSRTSLDLGNENVLMKDFIQKSASVQGGRPLVACLECWGHNKYVLIQENNMGPHCKNKHLQEWERIQLRARKSYAKPNYRALSMKYEDAY